MTIIEHPELVDKETGGLKADELSSRSELDASFGLFPDDKRTALVELDGGHRIVRCNRPRSVVHPRPAGGLPMTGTNAVIFIVDDDEAIRSGLSMLLQSYGYGVEAFPSASRRIPVVVLTSAPEEFELAGSGYPNIRIIRKPFASQILVNAIVESAAESVDEHQDRAPLDASPAAP